MTTKCDACGKEKNRYLVNQRFWSGEWDVEGIEETLRTLCNDCHRRLIRNR